jgi:adenine-specific DNA glycosylase
LNPRCTRLTFDSQKARRCFQKKPKLPKEKKQENRTVFVLRCGERWAIEKRPGRGLLAGLWQFPNESGHLEAEDAVRWAEDRGLHPKHVEKCIHRSHIFTHIRWDMTGYYLDVKEIAGDFVWMSPEEITEKAALPTAYRQFWDAEI